jgi:hypothetical protein
MGNADFTGSGRLIREAVLPDFFALRFGRVFRFMIVVLAAVGFRSMSGGAAGGEALLRELHLLVIQRCSSSTKAAIRSCPGRDVLIHTNAN